MRVERLNQEPWRPSVAQTEKVPLCPVCGAQGLEQRQGAVLCISCNHTWRLENGGR